ncbi:hypothetical protein OIU78_003738 [Salix suchowensis]|nr:hypothetical protein OIU78_003738 [Salix suchowensis]
MVLPLLFVFPQLVLSHLEFPRSFHFLVYLINLYLPVTTPQYHQQFQSIHFGHLSLSDGLQMEMLGHQGGLMETTGVWKKMGIVKTKLRVCRVKIRRGKKAAVTNLVLLMLTQM